jgi:hypothetical protein
MEALKDKFEPRRHEMLKMQSEAKSHPNDEDLQREFNRHAIEVQNSAYAARTAATQVVERSSSTQSGSTRRPNISMSSAVKFPI